MRTQEAAGAMRIGTPLNLWGADAPFEQQQIAVLPGVPERAFCILYVSPHVGRLEVLTSIYTQAKLGYREVAVLLPDPNDALYRSVDFEGLALLRHDFAARLIVITWSHRLSLLALWRHFSVYRTVNLYAATFSGRARVQPGAQPRLLLLLLAWGRLWYSRLRAQRRIGPAQVGAPASGGSASPGHTVRR